MTEYQRIEKIDLSQTPLDQEYYQCTFINCDLSNSNLSAIRFEQCRFESCNLSLIKVNNTAWQEVYFIDCKMTGVDLSKSHPFALSVGFERCMLTYCSLVGMRLRGTLFLHCLLQEVCLADATLTEAQFRECDLHLAEFDHTNIEKADLSTSYNYTIDPNRNKIRGARFSRLGLQGLLAHTGIVIVEA